MDIERLEIESIMREGGDVAGNLRENQDLFALRFAAWAMYDPQAIAYRETGCTAYALLEKYKSRPYVSDDVSQQ